MSANENIEELEALEDVEEEVEETVVTPRMLEEELSVDAKRIRAYLRQKHTRPEDKYRTSWHLTQDEVDSVRARFSPKGQAEELEGDEEILEEV